MIPIIPRRSDLVASALVFTLVLLAAPAQAQYMYLDSNGDGVHTAADVLSGTGTTTVDLWIDTAHNRDGSLAVCNTEPGTEMTINSYEVILHATGGTVAFASPVNRRPEMATHFTSSPPPMNSTDLYDGWGGGYRNPPGRYLLWTISVTAVTGSPSLACAPSTPILYYANTSFGCMCPGIDFDSTYKLGRDFLDTDGLPYSAAPPPNTPPVLDQPLDMVVATGETASQPLSARDANMDRLWFSKEAGPDYVRVFTDDPGMGNARGRVTVRPMAGTAGTAIVSIAATDGEETARASFQVTVVAGANHAPRLVLPDVIRVEAGAVDRELIYAGDFDGDALSVYKVSGPDFATVESPAPGAGGAYASVVVSPSACDVGSSALTVGVTDGIEPTETVVMIKVVESLPKPNRETRTFPGGIPYGVLTADWNEDGHLDVASIDSYGGAVVILLGHGDGTLTPMGSYPFGGSGAGTLPGATGDWDLDGHADLAVASFSDSVEILMGHGDGTFARGQTIRVRSQLDAVATGDFNQDGILDLVICGGGYAIALGRGDGSFTVGPVVPLNERAISIALGDYNRDGVMDFAVPSGNTVRVVRGLGDGSFELGPTYPLSEPPFMVAAADVNWDGLLDLVSFGWERKVQPLIGHVDGTFAQGSVADLGFSHPWSGTVGDWDGDGIEDAISATEGTGMLYVIRGDGQGNLLMPPLLAQSQPGANMGVATGDFNEDGRLDVVYGGLGLVLALNTRPPRSSAIARTFLVGGANALPTVPSARQVPFYLEPISGGFDLLSLDLSTIRLHSEGTGSVTSIAPSVEKSAVVGDVDENGLQEVAVRFASTELSKLFDGIHGRQMVPVSLDGALYSGGKFCSRFTLNLVGTGPRDMAVTVAPNPLNPTGVLSFETTKPGPVQVRLFDIQGRQLRVLLDTPMAEPSRFVLPIDGVDGGGRRLATGVYFFRVNAEGVERRGRFVVLK